jgi:hypothetical protein
MATRPLSLADRIREERKKNVPKEEIEKEKELVKSIESFNSSQRPSDQPTNSESNRPSERPANTLSNTITNTPSDLPTNTVAKQPIDRPINIVTELYRDQPTDIVTERHSDIAQQERKNSNAPDLTDRQFKVLEYIYFNRPFKIYSNSGLGAINLMGPNNAKNQINSLVSKGYIYKPYGINDGVNKGSTCRVVETKCMPIFGPTPIPNPPTNKPPFSDIMAYRHSDQPTNPVTQKPIDRHTNLMTERHSNQPTNIEVSPISSSSFNNITTTCQDLDSLIDTHPELGYWREKGLKAKQVDSWAKQFSLTHNDIIQSLFHCRFDMVDNEKEKLSNIKDVFNWFFKIIEKSGFYPKPKNYKTHHEKLIEREKVIIEDLKRQSDELKNARNERIKAEYGVKFEKMLLDENSSEFKEYYEELPKILKNPLKKGSISFKNAMKRLYCEKNDIEDLI